MQDASVGVGDDFFEDTHAAAAYRVKVWARTWARIRRGRWKEPGVRAPGDDTEKAREHERKKPGCKLLPEHLPRVEIEVLPLEVQCKGLDAFTRGGQETGEVLERRPASMVALRIVQPKFVERTMLLTLQGE